MWALCIAQRKMMFLGKRFCGRMKSACVTSMTPMNIEQMLRDIAIWTCFSTYRSKFHHAYALSGWQERYKRPRNSGKHIEGQPCGSWPFLPICWIRPSVEMCHGWKDKKNKISNLTNLAMISWLRFIVIYNLFLERLVHAGNWRENAACRGLIFCCERVSGWLFLPSPSDSDSD